MTGPFLGDADRHPDSDLTSGLQVRKVSKRFGATQALHHVDLDTLERLADLFEVEVGDLFERVK